MLGWAIAAILAAAVFVQPAGPVVARALPESADAPLLPELQYVPADAAVFAHADAQALWTGELARSFHAANKVLIDKFERFGVKPEGLKAATVFFPKIKSFRDVEQLGLILSFNKPLDKEKFTASVTGALPKDAKVKVVTPSDTSAVVLVGLGDEYAKPQPAGADGPLTGAIRAAASGKHTVVAGITLSGLPDELQGDDLPLQIRPFQPLLKAEAITATVTLGKSLDLAVRVKFQLEGQAVGAEKALGALATLGTKQLDLELVDLEKDAAKDESLKDLVTVLRAVLGAAKGGKFGVDGVEARLTATLPLADLPIAAASHTAMTRVTAAASARQSENNLKQIGIAMHIYHDVYDVFPPAAVCDKKGKPQLSWRVLILPYIEQEALYKEFKLDEPWDSEHNKKLLAKMPSVYALPGSKPGTTDTHYRVFVGNGAGFDWVMGGPILNIANGDGTSNTIMCVTAATGVPWTKPDELEFDPEKDMGKLIGFVAGGRAQMTMFDGSVRTLKKLPSKATLNALITRNGGEEIREDF